MPPHKQMSAKRNMSPVAMHEIVVLTPSAVLAEAAHTGIDVVLESTRAAFSESRKQLIACVVAVYAIAYYACEERKAWEEICNLKEWRDFKGAAPSEHNPEQALHYVMRLAVGMDSRDVLKKASAYTLALQGMFNEKVHPTLVEQRIREAGGLRGLEKLQAKKRMRKPLSKSNSHRHPQSFHTSDLPKTSSARNLAANACLVFINMHLHNAGWNAELVLTSPNGLELIPNRKEVDPDAQGLLDFLSAIRSMGDCLRAPSGRKAI